MIKVEKIGTTRTLFFNLKKPPIVKFSRGKRDRPPEKRGFAALHAKDEDMGKEKDRREKDGEKSLGPMPKDRECMQNGRECLALHLLIAFLDCEILRIYILPNLKRNPVGFLPPTRQTPAGLWNPSRLLVDFAVVEDTCSKERHANKVNGSDLRIGGDGAGQAANG